MSDEFAFPGFGCITEVHEEGSPGMTLRDYFAAAALQHVMATADRTNVPYELIAADCYRIADAMLAERDGDEDRD